MADSINILVPKESIDSIIAADKAITNLDVVYRKMVADIEQGTQTMKAAAGSMEAVKTAQAQAAKTAEELDATGKKLAQTEAQLKSLEDERTKTIIQNQKAISDRKKEILEEVKAEQAQVGSIAALRAENAKLTKERDNVNRLTEEGKKKILELNSALDRNNKEIQKNSSELEKQKINIGNYKSAFEGMPGPIGKAAGAVDGFGKTLKTMAATNPVILAITGIVAALAGLLAIFKSTGEGAKFFKTITAEIGAVLDVVKNRIVAFGKGLADVLSGRFKEGFKEMGAAISGVGGQLADATKAAKEYVDTISRINKERAAHISEEAEENNMIQKAIFLSKDKSKSDSERIGLLSEALNKSSEMAAREKKFAEDEYNATIKNKAARVEHLGVTAELLDKFVKMPEAQQMALIKEQGMWKETWNILKTDGVKELEELYAKGINADTEFFSKNKRNASQLATLREEMAKERESSEKSSFDKRVKMLQEEAAAIQAMAEEDKQTRANMEAEVTSKLATERDNQLNTLSDQYNRGAMETEDYEAEKLRITRKYEALILQEQLNAIDRVITETSGPKRAELEAKSAEIKLKINEITTQTIIDNSNKVAEAEKENIKSVADAQKEADKKREESEKAAAIRKKDLEQGFKELVEDAGKAIFEINNNRIEAEISDIERRRDAEIKAAGDNKDAQTKINEKYDKEVAAQKTKQAKNDRLAALFNIAINTAVAVSKASPDPILMGLAAAIGIIESGVVLSKEIPKYAKGTRGKYDTPTTFIAGEAGMEWIQNKTGQIAEVNKPTLFTNAQGMRVYSNRELADLNRMNINNHITSDGVTTRELVTKFDRLAKVLENQPQTIMQNGKPIGYRRGNYSRTYIERMV